MAFFRFLLTYSRWTLLFSILTGLVSGFGLSGLMAVIHRSLENVSGGTPALLVMFFLLWTAYGVTCIFSEFLLLRLSEVTAFRLKVALSRQIFKKPLRELEEIGGHRLFAVLVEDVNAITHQVRRLPNAFINVAIVFGCYGYMLWLSPALFLFNLCFLAVAVILFTIPNRIAKHKLAEARETADTVIDYFRHMTRGIKELILHDAKRRELLTGHLDEAAQRLMMQNIRSKTVYLVSQRIGDLLVLADIGCIVFILPAFFKVDNHVLTGFILACLFSLSPLSTLLSLIAQWAEVSVSLKKVRRLGFDLFEKIADTTDPVPAPDAPTDLPIELGFDHIQFEYTDEANEETFRVGPVSLKMNGGELVFLVGGNGSGKTTLAKLICGLYPPQDGHITWNGEPVTDSNRNRFHQNFSVIFSEYFLFRHLIGVDDRQIRDHGDEYLCKLKLDKKVSLRNREFSTLDLSFGQQKRLALMAACLEDRPVYIFDEWAAGQDPSFKKIFYEQILAELKARNKLVIVITHDDAYFTAADRLLKLENGNFTDSGSC